MPPPQHVPPMPPPRMPLPPVAAPPMRPPLPISNVARVFAVTPRPHIMPAPVMHHPPMPPNPFMPPAAAIPPLLPPPPAMAPPSAFDEGPAAKRIRMEEDFEPEGIWLQRVHGHINVQIQTPPTSEWNLEGKTFNIGLDITSPVSLFLWISR